MITSDDVRRIPLFESLDIAAAKRLAEAAADVHLAAAEWAVHEGGERALYAVIAGRIEVVKRVDGIERTLGWRLPGTLFGEVPIVFGTAFQGGFRAAEPSRVLRLDVRQYFDVAAGFPDVSQKLGAIARERIGGLQGLAAEPPKPRLKISGQRWDTACGDLRRFLARNQVPFESVAVDVDGPFVVELVDGAQLTAPSPRAVAQALGLPTRASSEECDTLIIGGGPAGLAAAVYGASEGLRTVVIEREAPGGQAGTSSRIENYLGFPGGVSGDELASRALQQARRLGAEILVTRTVTRIEPRVAGSARVVHLDGGEMIRAKTIILATGVSWRRLAIEGFDRLIGKGIYYGAARSEAGNTHGVDVHIIGAGNSAGQAAMNFANYARSVTMILRGDSLEKSMSRYLIEQLRSKANIAVRPNSEVAAVHGAQNLEAIDVVTAGAPAERIASGGLFVFIGADAETSWLPPEIACDARGYVLTGSDVAKSGRWSERRDPYLLETCLPGVFACGDVRLSPIKRVAAAVGEGSMAIALVHQYLSLSAS